MSFLLALSLASLVIGMPYRLVAPTLMHQTLASNHLQVTAPSVNDPQTSVKVVDTSGHTFQAVYEENAGHRLSKMTLLEDSPSPLDFVHQAHGSNILAKQIRLVFGKTTLEQFEHARVIAQRPDGGAIETLLKGPSDGFIFSVAKSQHAFSYCITVATYADASKQYNAP